ncbi:MAG TPA: glycerol-3-phosphate acyltransferase [Caldilineaceae bacterium]|nr:glycerol-3-phosphate acyltransferase [Caldilineaceae bacterium]
MNYFLLLVAYCLGCFTTGYYLMRVLTRRDIRTVGSGNVGSRNVGRVLGAKGFVLTLLGDAGKGLLALWLAKRFGSADWLPTGALLAVVVGHIWPIQLRFRGGKGLATFAGGMLLLQPLVLALGVVLCALLYPLLRGTTKSALLVLLLSPGLWLAVHLYGADAWHFLQFLLYCLLVVVVLFAHRSNIRAEYFRGE